MADLIQTWEENLPPHIRLAYLLNDGMVRLRLSTSGENNQAVLGEIDQLFAELQILVRDYLVTNVDEPLEKVVNSYWKKKQTLATAESCSVAISPT